MEPPPSTLPASVGAHSHSALPTIGLVLRPVIFVVDATHSTAPGHHHEVDDGEEPFDVRRTSLSNASEGLYDANVNLYDALLAALQGKPPGWSNSNNSTSNVSSAYDDELSFAPSYASSAPPFSPGSSSGGVDGDNNGIGELGTPPPPPKNKRFMSPFSRIKVRRWKNSSPGALDDTNDNDIDKAPGTSSHHHALAKDMEEDPDDHTTATETSSHSDNVSTALSSYSKDNPPVHFMSKRARVVAVSRRHAFPPSKFPKGKMDDVNVGGTSMVGEIHSGGNYSWMQSYDVQQEGILPSGWLEKHARALPSAVVVVTTLKITNDDARRVGIKNAVRAVDDLRMTLAEKRSVPIHLVCLMRDEERKSKKGVKPTAQRNLNAIKEKICQECYLPQSQVFLLKYPVDLEPDDFEAGILKSPYLNRGDNDPLSQQQQQQQQQQTTEKEIAERVMMNPLLRQLDRSLRDTSALYYSRLAEAQERKLMLWRNRYHNTNASFEVNTLMAAMRCARYAMKVGTLREFQMRTGGAGGGGQTGGGGNGGRWTDKGSSAMRHYDEAYRWVTELHRRAIAWRVASLSSSQMTAGGGGNHPTFPSPAPVTPRYTMMDDMASPNLTVSPGGGIGVELSLPGAVPPPPIAGATPPPPGPPPMMRRDSPALTSVKGYHITENIAFFALLWEQCRAVASILNAKLLRSATSHGWTEEQWSRHKLTFLAPPRGIPNFAPNGNDDFFGPAWHRFLYLVEEIGTFACVAEGRWRRICSAASSPTAKNNPSAALLSPSYHQTGAPWRAYGELSEAMLGLRKIVQNQLGSFDSCDWTSVSSASSSLTGRRKFVGSIVGGNSGLGSMGWRFDNESRRNHSAIALDYVLHALDLLDENISLSNPGSAESSESLIQPSSSARLHYIAARLLMSLDKPMGASVHLKIAAGHTEKWPSMHLSIQRALFACEERCKAARMVSVHGGPASPSSVEAAANDPAAESKGSYIELLLRSDSCKLLSRKEMANAQTKAWKNDALPSEVVWKHDDLTPKTNPPFEFAVSFLKSTHAMSSDTVTACVSIKSCLDFDVCVQSLQLLTTSGTYDVSNLHQCVDKTKATSLSLFQSSTTTEYVPNRGVQFKSNDKAYFLTDISIPSNLSNIALGGSSADISKFIPKNGRLCNMGLSHAAGNICESRFDNGSNNSSQQKISINGKPIAISAISETSSSLLGGIPLVCHGVALTLKLPSASRDPLLSLRLSVESPRLISPLLRSGVQRLAMEECNYTAHSWSRPAHHPWCLGPRVLRVLGPQPRMQVTNLTDSLTDCKAVEGTVNRIMFRLKAGSDEDCWDVRVRLLCVNLKKPLLNNQSADDATTPDGGFGAVEPHRMPTFVQKSATSIGKTVTGVALPQGWEPRTDVGTDQSHHATTTICPHLGAGKSLIYPLDIYCPLGDQSFQENNGSATCSSYEVVIMYRQVRTGKGKKQNPNEPGDEVMVMQSGTVEWIPPVVADFSQTNGPKKPYPGGIQHASNTIENSQSTSEFIAADGERIHMRCSLEAKGLGSNTAASILRVSNESEVDESRRVLYSSESGFFMNQMKQGSKLSLSYSISAQKESGSNISLGVISADWKPADLPPLDLAPTDSTAIKDGFGLTHGPLSLPNLAPMIFHGPACEVLYAPFKAKLLKCPSTPKVGTPFRISYQVTNRTAKCQTLTLSLDDDAAGQEGADQASKNKHLQLLGTGKVKEETQMAPFEEKTYSFTFISMMAGKILRPPLTVSSGRHQTWVINETSMSSRYLFVMP